MRRIVGFALLSACLCLGSCTYFNMVYNAKQRFNSAENLRTAPGGTANAASGEYNATIKQCHKILRFHPNSKYVDDALYMIGVSHLWRGEYVQSQDAFQDLIERFPESEFLERALFHKGLAHLWNRDAGGAEQTFEKLRVTYPESDYNVEAVFRRAERSLESQDFDAARQELDTFIQQYPESPFVSDARVRLARTFYDEERYEEAQRAYLAVLETDIDKDLEYEARLHVALSRRKQAEAILADPALYTKSDLPEGLSLAIEALDETEAPGVTPFPDSGMPPSQSPAASNSPDPDSVGQTEAGTKADTGGTKTNTGGGTNANTDTGGDSPALGLEIADVLPDSLQQIRDEAEAMVAKSAEELRQLRKLSRKLNREFENRIELAVTHSLIHDWESAISELDQIGRANPRSAISSKAYFEMAEIYRRQGRLSKAREFYDATRRQGQQDEYNREAGRKSNAIQARALALENLKGADEVLRQWRMMNGVEELDEGNSPFKEGEDSLTTVINIETRFEDMAAELMRVAEIDLFDLDQPRLALREFQKVLSEYPGSRQSARSAFAIAWIYENTLGEDDLALAAYQDVQRKYPRSPQAREARYRIERWSEREFFDRAMEVMEPSSQP